MKGGRNSLIMFMQVYTGILKLFLDDAPSREGMHCGAGVPNCLSWSGAHWPSTTLPAAPGGSSGLIWGQGLCSGGTEAGAVQWGHRGGGCAVGAQGLCGGGIGAENAQWGRRG